MAFHQRWSTHQIIAKHWRRNTRGINDICAFVWFGQAFIHVESIERDYNLYKRAIKTPNFFFQYKNNIEESPHYLWSHTLIKRTLSLMRISYPLMSSTLSWSTRRSLWALYTQSFFPRSTTTLIREPSRVGLMSDTCLHALFLLVWPCSCNIALSFLAREFSSWAFSPRASLVTRHF